MSTSDDSQPAKQRREDMERVRLHVNQLIEHYDSVRIFCNRHMPAEMGGTISINLGAGNWFARFGQVSEWVIHEKERIKINARADE